VRSLREGLGTAARLGGREPGGGEVPVTIRLKPDPRKPAVTVRLQPDSRRAKPAYRFSDIQSTVLNDRSGTFSRHIPR
jgi:hypothetical protein